MGALATAARLARETPASRNRVVDLLRAGAILAVVLGHWFAAAPWVRADGELVLDHVLAAAPWTHWLSWAIQVMPIFFLVGGYSNGLSWSASRRRGGTYAAWLDARLRRLVGPVVVLVLAWLLLGIAGNLLGFAPTMVGRASQMALIPTWFLATYVVVVLLVPLTLALWERLGLASFWLLAGCAALVDLGDLVLLPGGLGGAAWVNYLFVWTAVHQLGYAWRDGRLAGARAPLLALGGGLALFALVHFGPYPISMVGVPGEAISNTTPPRIVLLALGCLQGGLALTCERPLARWLERAGPWTATVLVNASIMTLYLWHMTAIALVFGLARASGDLGLHHAPASAGWYWLRPLWMVLGALALLPFLAAFGRFERPRPTEPGREAPAWRLVLGAGLVCAALAHLALLGVASDGPLGLRPVPPLLLLAALVLFRHLPGQRRSGRRA